MTTTLKDPSAEIWERWWGFNRWGHHYVHGSALPRAMAQILQAVGNPDSDHPLWMLYTRDVEASDDFARHSLPRDGTPRASAALPFISQISTPTSIALPAHLCALHAVHYETRQAGENSESQPPGPDQAGR
jgi:hypothetical protein